VRTWLWPAGGRVLRAFDASLHKGIDIGGARGDAVRAAAGGRVVYAGSGIAGYGLMLILRHNDEYLSAYGHNDELLVTEGSTVRAGDPIARLGSSGTDGVKLHFEIRRGGRPVDPRDLLPPR
jgi:lipoprotein NlpD